MYKAAVNFKFNIGNLYYIRLDLNQRCLNEKQIISSDTFTHLAKDAKNGAGNILNHLHLN